MSVTALCPHQGAEEGFPDMRSSNRLAALVLLGIPLVACLALASWSFTGLFVVMAWTGVGFIAFKAAGVRIASTGRGPKWAAGWRKLILVSHRLCLWPYYVTLRLQETR